MFASPTPLGDAICIRLQRHEIGMSGLNEWDFVRIFYQKRTITAQGKKRCEIHLHEKSRLFKPSNAQSTIA